MDHDLIDGVFVCGLIALCLVGSWAWERWKERK